MKNRGLDGSELESRGFTLGVRHGKCCLAIYEVFREISVSRRQEIIGRGHFLVVPVGQLLLAEDQI